MILELELSGDFFKKIRNLHLLTCLEHMAIVNIERSLEFQKQPRHQVNIWLNQGML